MSESKDGDKVLLDATLLERHSGSWKLDTGGCVTGADGCRTSGYFRADDELIHPHPGVPVADLMEALDIVDEFVLRSGAVVRYNTSGDAVTKALLRYNEIRAAREAAKKPKEIPEPNWKVLCRRLWNEAKGGYDKVRPEYVVPIVEEINDWIEQEALRGTEDGLPEKGEVE